MPTFLRLDLLLPLSIVICAFTDASATPDLTITDARTIGIEVPQGQSYAVISFAYTIRNLGTSEVDVAGITLQTFLLPQGGGASKAAGGTSVSLGSSILQPGESHEYFKTANTNQISDQTNVLERYPTLKLIVDWGDEVTEIDETNNEYDHEIADTSTGWVQFTHDASGNLVSIGPVQSGQPPSLTGESSVRLRLNELFGYQITATGNPGSYGAVGLPVGLELNPITGFISGTPLQAGIFPVLLSATNQSGTGTLSVNFRVSTPAVSPFSAFVAQSVLLDLGSGRRVLSAKGLPTGLAIINDSFGGSIEGRPTRAGVFRTRLVIRNADGTRVTEIYELRVNPIPSHAVGIFHTIVDRDPRLARGLGGHVRFVVSSGGGVSGVSSLIGGNVSYRGSVEVISATDVRMKATVFRKRQPNLDLDVYLGVDDLATGSISEQGTVVGLSGWRQTWLKRIREVPVEWRSRLNVLMEITDEPWISRDDVPQGIGFATAVVGRTGAMSWAMAFPDGTRRTRTSLLGPKGFIGVWSLMGQRTGSAIFHGELRPDGAFDGVGNWVRHDQPLSAERFYRTGFGYDGSGPVPLRLTGRPWRVPARGEMIAGLELPEIDANLRIVLDGGGVKFSQTSTPPTSAWVGLNHRVTAPGAGSTENPAGIRLFLNPKTGAASGDFILRDSHFGSMVVRKVPFTGLLLEGLDGGVVGGGLFGLPELPNPTATPPTSLKTSPILTGSLLLERDVDPLPK